MLGVPHHSDLLLVHLVLSRLPALFFAASAVFHLGNFRLSLLYALIVTVQCLLQLLHFPFPAQQVLCFLLNAAAGHAATGVHHIALQRHQTEGLISRPHDSDTAVQVFGDDRAAQQALHDAPVFGIVAAQFTGHANAAGHIQYPSFVRIQRPPVNRAQGQKSGASQPVLPQVFDQALGVLFSLGHNVLHRAA